MANYKVVDADRLDADLASVADSIRAKAGTTDQMAFPDGFKSAVEGIQTGGSVELPDAEDATFGTGSGSDITEYKVQRSTMDGLADEARRIGETENELSTDEMLDIFGTATKEIVLPNAENATFGSTSGYEYAIENYSPTSHISSSTKGTFGAAFTANADLQVIGFVFAKYGTSDYPNIQLWDITDSQMLVNITAQKGEIFLDTPVQLKTGKNYAVVERGSWIVPYYQAVSELLINGKITFIGAVNHNSGSANPSNTVPSVTTTQTWYCGINLIMQAAISEDTINEYKVQLNTMTSIADEVKRIIGSSGQLTTAQIITALKGIASTA